MLKISIFNCKGGVGKTTTAINLSAALAQKWRVLLIDLDGQRSLSFNAGVEGKIPTSLSWLHGKFSPAPISERLWIVPGDIDMFRFQPSYDVVGPAMLSLKGFDVAIVDCPPALAAVSVQAILHSDRVLIPIVCEPSPLKGLSEAILLIQEARPAMPIDVLRTMHQSRLVITRESDFLVQSGVKELGYHLLETTIPKNVAIVESVAHYKPVTEYQPRSSGAIAYNKLATECEELWRLEEKMTASNKSM